MHSISLVPGWILLDLSILRSLTARLMRQIRMRSLYNDYNLDQPAKLDFALEMIAELRDRGIRIHGLGYQGHFLNEPAPLIERVLKIPRRPVFLFILQNSMSVSCLMHGSTVAPAWRINLNLLLNLIRIRKGRCCHSCRNRRGVMVTYSIYLFSIAISGASHSGAFGMAIAGGITDLLIVQIILCCLGVNLSQPAYDTVIKAAWIIEPAPVLTFVGICRTYSNPADTR